MCLQTKLKKVEGYLDKITETSNRIDKYSISKYKYLNFVFSVKRKKMEDPKWRFDGNESSACEFVEIKRNKGLRLQNLRL